jgi:hypothetical protein
MPILFLLAACAITAATPATAGEPSLRQRCREAFGQVARLLARSMGGPEESGLGYLAIRAFHTQSTIGHALLHENPQYTTVGGYLGPGRRYPFVLEVGPELGFGMVAGVYSGQVRGIPAIDQLPNRPARFALKFPHRWNFLGSFLSGKSVLVPERLVYQATLDNVARMEAEPDYPANPAWGRGRIPTLPIYGMFQTSIGPVLVKPITQGQTLAQIYRQYRPATAKDLPEPMRQSLEDLRTFARIANRVATVELTPGQPTPLRLDINPNNLVWISDAEEMRRYGMTRPGFITYEFGQLPPSGWDYAANLNYEDLVVGFMQSEGMRHRR